MAKLQGEKYITRSGNNYTFIPRPGGLKNNPPSGNVIMVELEVKPHLLELIFVRKTLSGGSISRVR